MPSAIRLPASLLSAYQNLFPTLNFGNIHFYLGLPWFVPKGKGGFTLPDALSASEVTIYLRPDCYDSNSAETFLLIAHELVHAQQIQDMAFGVGLAHPFVASYLGCALANGDFSGSRRNLYEAEAYAYANGPHATLRQFPGTVKGAADTGTAACLTKTAGAIGSTTASVIGALEGGLIGWCTAGPMGAPAGAAGGGAVGLVLGHFWGITSFLIGVLISVVLGLAGAIFAALRSFSR
jgi:hypothetical protein